MTKTEKKIIELLKEDTGKHFLDSGGAYGRHWQKNQGRDFLQEDPCSVRIEANEEGKVEYIDISYSLFHFLNNFLEFDDKAEKFQKGFMKFANTEKWKREPWEDCLKAYFKKRSWEVEKNDYTYGKETLLDQDFAYWIFYDKDDEEYVVVRVHGGCDARGGFSSPCFFKMFDHDQFYTGMRQAFASCDGVLPEEKGGETAFFDMEEIHCENYWDLYDNEWLYQGQYGERDNNIEDLTTYNEETKELKCKCGGTIHFSVMECW